MLYYIPTVYLAAALVAWYDSAMLTCFMLLNFISD